MSGLVEMVNQVKFSIMEQEPDAESFLKKYDQNFEDLGAPSDQSKHKEPPAKNLSSGPAS